LAKISTYVIDGTIVDGDKVIGSDANNDLQTKNYKIGDLVNYFAASIGNNLLVPYVGATNDVDLGTYGLFVGSIDISGTFTSNGSVGLPGEVLMSQGPGLPAVWAYNIGSQDLQNVLLVGNTADRNINLVGASNSIILDVQHLLGRTSIYLHDSLITNSSYWKVDSLHLESSTGYAVDYLTDKIRFTNAGNFVDIKASSYSNQSFSFPTNGGFIPMSVNGVYADGSGSITIPIGLGTVTAVTASLPLSSSGGVTPNISISQASALGEGYLSSADWNTFDGKQDPITLTTTGTSGAATFIGNVLNVPDYSGGSGTIPTLEQVLIAGNISEAGLPITLYDSPSHDAYVTITYNGGFAYGNDVNAYNGEAAGLNGNRLSMTIGALGITPIQQVLLDHAGLQYTFGDPTATFYYTGNLKYPNYVPDGTITTNTIYLPLGDGNLTLSVNGYTADSAGNITIPTGGILGSGTATQIAFWDTSSSIAGDSQLYWDNTNKYLGVNVAAPAYNLDVFGSANILLDNIIGGFPGNKFAVANGMLRMGGDTDPINGWRYIQFTDTADTFEYFSFNSDQSGNPAFSMASAGSFSINSGPANFGLGTKLLTVFNNGDVNIANLATGGVAQMVTADSTGKLGIQPIPTGGGGIPHATALGTDTYTATISGVTSYTDGDAYIIQFTNGNTTGATLDINGLGAVILYRNNDGVLIGGDITSGGEMICVYDNTLPGFRVIGTSPSTLVSYVTNADSVTITKGQVVYAFGGTGDRLTVKLANNTSEATSAQTVGIVMSASIATNQKGFIITQGLLDGLSILPTASFSDGDALYLGATAGAITNVKPYAPNHLVYLGNVTTASNGSAGRWYVRVQNGYELQELHNVQAQSPTLKDTLWYDNAVSPAQWKTASISTILGYTPLSGTGTTNYVPKWSSSTALSDSSIFDNGTNVNTTLPFYAGKTDNTTNWIQLNPTSVGTSPYIDFLYKNLVTRRISFISDSTSLNVTNGFLFSSDNTIANAQQIIVSDVLAKNNIDVQGGILKVIGTGDNYIRIYQRGVAERGTMGYVAGSGTFQIRVNGATNLTTGTQGLAIASTGAVTLPNLGGSGTVMVVSDNTGLLSTQTIPTAYTLAFTSTTTNLLANITYYFGNQARGLISTAAIWKVYIPQTGTIKKAYFMSYASTAVGDASNLSLYIRINNTSDTLVATVGVSAASREFSNTSLSIAVTAGDYIEMKFVTPNPYAIPATGFTIGGTIYIQ